MEKIAKIDCQDAVERARKAWEARKIVNTQKEDDKEDDFVASEPRPLIPEGIYKVRCIKIGKGVSQSNTFKMFLTFKIIDPGEYMGTELFMYINLIDTKTGKPFEKVPIGSKYYKQWVIANKNILPCRGDRMSSLIFKKGVFEAVVKTVKSKNEDGTENPDSFNYSKIDCLKKKIA